MQPETREIVETLNPLTAQESDPTSFRLFEEFSGVDIWELFAERKEKFRGANDDLMSQVQKEIRCFSDWLEHTKGYRPMTAHLYAVGLKSMLAGLPIGAAVGMLFSIALRNLETREKRGI